MFAAFGRIDLLLDAARERTLFSMISRIRSTGDFSAGGAFGTEEEGAPPEQDGGGSLLPLAPPESAFAMMRSILARILALL